MMNTRRCLLGTALAGLFWLTPLIVGQTYINNQVNQQVNTCLDNGWTGTTNLMYSTPNYNTWTGLPTPTEVRYNNWTGRYATWAAANYNPWIGPGAYSPAYYSPYPASYNVYTGRHHQYYVTGY